MATDQFLSSSDRLALSGLSAEVLRDAPFGVVVEGLDWDAPTDLAVEHLTALLRSHLLVHVRRGNSPSRDQLETFFRRFGRLVLDTPSGQFHYDTFSRSKDQYVYRGNDGNYVVNTSAGGPELVWHNDMSHRPETKTISVLEAIRCDSDAEPTYFRNMYVACELMPSTMRQSLALSEGIFFDPRRSVDDEPRLCDAMHPVLLHHPVSGRVAVYVNDHTKRIVGLGGDESADVLARIRAHVDLHAPVYVHRWSEGDVLIWDNVGLQHRRNALPPGQVRELRVFEGVAY